MPSTRARVHASGQFWVQDGDTASDVSTWDQSNGLVVTAATGAVILTGDGSGSVGVTVDVRPRRPPEAFDPLAFDDDDETGWDDIVEVSVTCLTGPLRVLSLTDGFADLPALDAAGPGTYRLRVHARGRDDRGVDDDGFPVLVDEYLLVCWPADPRPPLAIRLTDRRGLDVRYSLAMPEPRR